MIEQIFLDLASTIGKMLGTALSCDFLDADDFHSSSNRGKKSKNLYKTEFSCVNNTLLMVQPREDAPRHCSFG